MHAGRPVIAMLGLVLLVGAAPPSGPIRPHLVGRIAYQGELGETTTDVERVIVFRNLPAGVSTLGEAIVVVADEREPSAESAERVLKEVAARLGGDALEVREALDVTGNFRKPSGEQPRGAAALEEWEMAAVVARAHSGGGPLLLGNFQLNITPADRFGDSDVTGPVNLTLSRTHDMREWSIGRVGPRYRAEPRDARLTVVTGPSGVEYDVRIVSKRAKVYRRGERTELTRVSGNPGNLVAPRQVELFYTEFKLRIGTFVLGSRRR